MRARDVQRVLEQMRAATAALEEAAPVLEASERLEADAARLRQEIAALEGQRTQADRALSDSRAAVVADQAKQAQAHARAEESVKAQLDGVLRQVKATETTLARLKAEEAGLTDQRSQAEADHRQRIQALVEEERQARAALAATQQKIKAVHADLAGLGGR